jgi:peroxiredoxin
MIKTFLLGAIAAFSLIGFQPATQAAEVGQPAPEFTGVDTNGKEHKLSDFKGKVVVLEWTNAECPYVVKHYDSGNMQKLQETYTAKDVVWLTINSGAEGKQGHVTAEQANDLISEKGGKQTAYLLDTEGTIGKIYDAKVTPHMFVINKEGTLVYNGAIDDNDSSKAADIATSKNYVVAALDATLDGKPVETAQSKPYGCGVKY